MRRGLAVLLALVVLATVAPAVGLDGLDQAPASASSRRFGSRPLDDVLHWAAQERRCGLTTNRLAAMMLAPTYPETGTPLSASPSPMTLSRWDNQSGLHSFGTVAGQARAFWHPGIGPWQFDSAGLGAPFSAAQRIDTFVVAAQVAATMAERWCVGRSLAYVWAPWHGCGPSTCRRIYDAIYRPASDQLVGVAADAEVGRRGGMTRHLCSGPGRSGTFPCWRVDPARAQGHRAFADPGFGPAPITAPFYVYAAGGREYRHWLRRDTGYRRGVWASRPLGANARTALTWQRGEPLTVVTTPPPPPAPTTYPDVAPTAAYRPALDRLVAARVVTPDADGRFRPRDPLTRGDGLIWVWRLVGRPAASGSPALTDVGSRTPLARAAAWAVGAGVVGGFADDTFRPDRLLTRAALTGLLWRAAGRPEAAGPVPFADVARTTRHRRAIVWAAARSYLVGVAGTEFAPGAVVSRRLAVRWLDAAGAAVPG